MFLIRLQPLPNESISSWRLRNGLANGYKFFPRPTGCLQLLDPDYLSDPTEESWLTNNFNIDISALRSLTLETTNGKVSLDDNRARRKRWVIASGNGANASLSGPGACPLCMTSATPYFRLAWRYAFCTYCPEHKIFLIDRCHSCSQKLWPFNFSKCLGSQHTQLGNCHNCGESLHQSGQQTKTDDLYLDPWRWIVDETIPSEYSFTTDLRNLFDALWCICQLLGRKNSFDLWKHIPSSLINQIGTAPSAPFQYFELASIATRHATFKAAAWLMQDWPDRFIQTCLESHVYKSTILANSVYCPQFYSDIATKYLARKKRNSIRVIDVETAINNLSKQGGHVTKKQVRKTLGVQESRAIDALMNQRRHATLKEFLLLCGAFEGLIKETSSSRDQLITLKRDYLVFLLSVLFERNIEFVCAQPKEGVLEILHHFSKRASIDSEKSLVCSRAFDLNIDYAHNFSGRISDPLSGIWFIGRYGGRLDGHTVRERVAKLITKSIGGNLWNSADAFRNVLSDNQKFGRRHTQPKFSDVQLSLF